jgi:hydroxymethylpyrimidine pyrophosphatase-like HAD family hydrolase
MRLARAVRRRRRTHVAAWREEWKANLRTYLQQWAAPGRDDRMLGPAASAMVSTLGMPLPDDLGQRRIRIPAAFRTQDLTHLDLFALAHVLSDQCPDRDRPILVVGLRTAGSYFAPLIQAWLTNAGYRDVDWVTTRPTRMLSGAERATLSACARRQALAVVVDEAPNTGGALANAVSMIRQTGFARSDVALLVPVHATRRDWANAPAAAAIAGIRTLTLPPGEWRKPQWLAPDLVERRVREYFLARGYLGATVVHSSAAQWFNQQLRRASDEKFHTRLKQVFEVRLRDRDGAAETRYVLAKSVGWGWLSYHAFLAADRLARFVPTTIGLRDGILYSEWLRPVRAVEHVDRPQAIATLASYVAARANRLRLNGDPADDVGRGDQHKGLTLLAAALSRASGWKPAAMLQRARIRHELARTPAPCPTLIDGKMRPHEWVVAGDTLRKTDFEHHGLGKTELNLTDPAYDLADAILHFALSPGEEHALLRQYAEQTGDRQVGARLFVHKLLAGTWARATAIDNLSDPRLVHRHEECHQQYLAAGNFLVLQTARHCAGLSHRPPAVQWGTPLVVLDIDGVLDKQIFGYPSTTAAGIHAISLLHAHGVAVAVNTARSLAQVQEYCDAYGFAGGVAEYGGIVWDAVTRRARRLVSADALDQLERVSTALADLPGVFLDRAYRCGLRAYTFERGTTVPLPTLLIRNLIARLGADQLTVHQTFVDTTVIPREVDKGHGLKALLDLAGRPDARTIAIGDSEADLAMFRVAHEAYAPSHISCRSAARLLGCRVMDRPFQSGLLQAVRHFLHAHEERCAQCRVVDPARMTDRTLFADLLAAADQAPWRLMVNALVDPMALQTFAKH